MNEEDRRKYEAFQYWIQTNTEKGVTTIPDTLCLFVVNLIKSLQKENEELKRLMAHKNGYTKLLEEDLFENCSNYVIPIQTIKGKIEELIKEGRHYNANKIEVLQELLEGRK